jgi:DNA-binding IclR family transcriptional regulator
LRNLEGSWLGARQVWLADMLARTTGETVWVAQLWGGEVHIAHQAFLPGDVAQIFAGEIVLPWHACAVGHAIVAGLDKLTQERLLALPASRLTGLTVTKPGDLRLMLDLTRQRGYAIEAHTATLGEAGIAAPIADPSGRVIASIGIVGPVERVLPAQLQEALAQAVCATARELSRLDTESASPGNSPESDSTLTN